MRPLTLSIDGLRSYRHPTTLNFSGVNLLAIVGDTGAGKSSILEAITYALYSSATWTGQPGELIADGVRTMKVALTFEADGKRWQVTRSMSRDGYPAPVHRLVCEDDGLAVNGRTEVNATIERLVGLDCKAFLQSVILPQGRFAELLKATPTERGKILQNIFRVDELVAARDAADRLLVRWEPRHDGFVTKRSLYLPDPAGAAKEASERRANAESRRSHLDELRKTVVLLHDSASQAERDATEFDALAARLGDPALAGSAAELSQLATAAAELAALQTALDETRQQARQRERNAAAQLERAVHDGIGLSGLTKAEAVLEALARELEAVAEAIDQAVNDTALVDAARQQAEQQQVAATTAAQKAADAQANADAATETAKQAIAVRDTARAALLAYHAKAEQQASVADELRRWQQELDTRRVTAERLDSQALEATAKANAADQELHELQRAAAAATASHDCHPGDPCPICDRELPMAWQPRSTPKLDTAHRQRDQAMQTRDKARTQADQAAGLYSAAAERDKELCTSLCRAERASEQSLARLAEASLLTPKQLTAKLPDDDAILARVESGASNAETHRDRATAMAATERVAATEANADAKAAAKDAADRERSLRSSLEKATKTCVALRARAATLPEIARPEVAGQTALDLTVTPEERGVALGTARVADALAVVRTHLTELRRIEAEGTDARKERERLDGQLEALQVRWNKEIVGPTLATARHTDKLANCLLNVLTRLDQPPAPPRPTTDEPVELAGWARAIEKAAATATKTLAQQVKTTRDRAVKEHKQAADLLTKASISDVDSLDAAVVDAATAARIAAGEERAALAQIPLVADLDDRIKRGGAFLDDLRAVHELLANSRFIGFLMHRRQQALLGVATTLLAEMSGGRFGFSEDFQVIDCYSGQPRSTSTLSGGESFLASMALALAMVELAGRAGGRLESLFLDEGFGSLDAKTLDVAIDMLEGRAKSGRLVAVISHVKTVAERIEDVLVVSYNPSDGTTLRMLTTAERVGLVHDDATDAVAGLLS